MQTSRQLLASIVEIKVWSYYRLAKEMGQSRKVINQLRNGQQSLSDEQTALVAEWLEVDPLYVLACARAERAKRKGMKSLWERVARGATAVAVLLWLFASLALVQLPII